MKIVENLFTPLPAVLLLLAVSFSCSPSSDPASDTNLFDYLDTNSPIEATLETDMESLLSQGEETSYQPAQLKVRRPGQAEEAFSVSLKPRGHSRRQICDFPPLKLNFDQSSLQEKGLGGPDKLKLVTHCIDGDTELVLKEFLAYRLYNTLTDRSFRVQLLHIRYIDEQGGLPEQSYYAFLIEPVEAVANRLQAGLVGDGEKLAAIQAEDYRRFVLFQYMIGNTDWNISRRHNLKLLQMEGESFPVPMPYDFDQSGLVNADYARPYPSLPIEEVTQRFFQWRGKNTDGMDTTVKSFQEKEEAFLNVVYNMEGLSLSARKEMIDYLKEFFQLLERKGHQNSWAAVFSGEPAQS